MDALYKLSVGSFAMQQMLHSVVSGKCSHWLSVQQAKFILAKLAIAGELIEAAR